MSPKAPSSLGFANPILKNSLTKRKVTAAIVNAPKAPTAPASLGVAQPNRMEPFTTKSSVAAGRKLIRISAGI